MRIDRIDLYHITQRLVTPFVTSFGYQEERQCLLVALHSGDNEGWGECAATIAPGYSYETVKTAWHVMTDFLIPAVIGREFTKPEELAGWLVFVRGHPLAKASLDAAAWDLAARRDGLSLAQKLHERYYGGPKERIEVGVSIGIQGSVDELLSVIASYAAQGYRRIKLKIRPGFDLDPARAVRSAFPSKPVMLDANSAYTLADTPVFVKMDELNLLMLEQPLHHDDIIDHSHLRPQISTPLCLDESILSADLARQAIEIGACDIINIKPGRVGGLSEARRIHDVCFENGIPVWCGGMLETGIGRAAQLALASLPGFSLPGDISATARYYHEDVARPDFVLSTEDSTIQVPTDPGLGVEVDRNRLSKVTLRQESFEP